MGGGKLLGVFLVKHVTKMWLSAWPYTLSLDQCSLKHWHFSYVYILTYLLGIPIAERAGVWPVTILPCLLRKKSLFMCLLIFISGQLQMTFLPFLVSPERYYKTWSLFTFFKAFLYWLRLPFSACLLYSSNCGKCIEVRGIINASKLHASPTEHEGRYCFSHWDYSVSSDTLAIWSSCYQKSQYLHFVEYACPPVFGKRAIWYLCLYDYLVCIHKILSANPLMIQR